MAILALILGIVGLLLSCIAIGIVPCVIALILAILVLKGNKPGRGLAVGGLVTSIIGIVIFVVIMIGVSGSDDNKEPSLVKTEASSSIETEETEAVTEEETEETTEEEKTSFGVGETAEMNDIQVTLVGYEESSGSEYNKPSDGNVFLLLNFDIANNSDKELSISSMMSFEAYADDYTLNYSIGALMAKPDETQLDGTIAPGKKMNGWIGYEVPADWKNMEIHFTDNVWSDNKFVFEITK